MKCKFCKIPMSTLEHDLIPDPRYHHVDGKLVSVCCPKDLVARGKDWKDK